MTEQDRIKRLEQLAQDQAHVRRAALHEAAVILCGSEDEIVERLTTELLEDEEDVEDGTALYNAHEELIEAIAKEVVRIGDELMAHYRMLKKDAEKGMQA